MLYNFTTLCSFVAFGVSSLSSQKALLSRAMKISEMRDSVNKKRIELERLQRLQTLSRVLEAQVRPPMILNVSFIFFVHKAILLSWVLVVIQFFYCWITFVA